MWRIGLVLGVFACNPPPAATVAPVARATVEAPAPILDPAVREESRVTVDGVEERWRLVWRDPPKPICHEPSPNTAPCACWSFDYAEAGKLDLQRLRGAEKLDTLDVSHLAGEPSDYELWVPHWRRAPNEKRESVPIAEAKKGEVITLMRFADYDHDGRATEFPLIVDYGIGPCGHYSAWVVIGVSKDNPHLHAFETKEGGTLYLGKLDDWQRLSRAKPAEKIRIDDIACGDHGSPEATFRNLWFDAAGFHEESKTAACE